MELFVSSSNPHKITELNGILNEYRQNHSGLKLTLTGLDSLDDTLQQTYHAEENAETFMENAFIKAEALFKLVKHPVIAEDTGLEVDALGGRPGVHSARYAPNDTEKISKLLDELKTFKSPHERKARFITCLCFLDEYSNPLFFTGKAEGTIAFTASGIKGFGYDPVFICEELNVSFASLPAEKKNQVSHRAKAMLEFLNFFERWQRFGIK